MSRVAITRVGHDLTRVGETITRVGHNIPRVGQTITRFSQTLILKVKRLYFPGSQGGEFSKYKKNYKCEIKKQSS